MIKFEFDKLEPPRPYGALVIAIVIIIFMLLACSIGMYPIVVLMMGPIIGVHVYADEVA